MLEVPLMTRLMNVAGSPLDDQILNSAGSPLDKQILNVTGSPLDDPSLNDAGSPLDDQILNVAGCSLGQPELCMMMEVSLTTRHMNVAGSRYNQSDDQTFECCWKSLYPKQRPDF